MPGLSERQIRKQLADLARRQGEKRQREVWQQQLREYKDQFDKWGSAELSAEAVNLMAANESDKIALAPHIQSGHEKLQPAFDDLEYRHDQITKDLEKLDKSNNSTNRRAADRALDEYERVHELYVDIVKSRLAAEDPKIKAKAIAALKKIQKLRNLAKKAREKLKGKRRKHREAKRKLRKRQRRNRRSRERREMEARKKARAKMFTGDPADDKRTKKRLRGKGSYREVGRSLGLAQAPGVGLALLAYIHGLKPEERQRFLALPNIIGITQAAVEQFEADLRERDRKSLEYLKEFQRQVHDKLGTADGGWLATRVINCFQPPRALIASWRNREGGNWLSSAAVRVPVRAETILDAVRAVYRTRATEGRCAAGVDGAHAYIALRIAQVAQRAPSAQGWVRFAPNPFDQRRKIVIHLPTRLRALTGDLRPMTTKKNRSVTPLDLHAFRNNLDGAMLASTRTAVRRPASTGVSPRLKRRVASALPSAGGAPLPPTRAPAASSPGAQPAGAGSVWGSIGVRRGAPPATPHTPSTRTRPGVLWS